MTQSCSKRSLCDLNQDQSGGSGQADGKMATTSFTVMSRESSSCIHLRRSTSTRLGTVFQLRAAPDSRSGVGDTVAAESGTRRVLKNSADFTRSDVGYWAPSI